MVSRKEALTAMWPTVEEVRTAAYHRWQRRGGVHGFDRHDWQAAEDDLLFRRNYCVLARRRLDGVVTPQPGVRGRHCRFCERGEPQAAFGRVALPVAGLPGLSGLLGGVECDECGETTRSMAEEFARFARPFRAVAGVRGLAEWPSYRWDGRWAGHEPLPASTVRLDRPDGRHAVWHRSEPYVPLAALKFLARVAVGLVPESASEEFHGTIEWASNPDHALDRRALGTPTCRVYLAPVAFDVPWISLARRVDDGVAVPSTLIFLAVGHAVFQAAVPLCNSEDETDGEPVRVPAVGLPGDADGPPWECPWLDVPLDAAEPRHGAALELIYCGDRAARL